MRCATTSWASWRVARHTHPMCKSLLSVRCLRVHHQQIRTRWRHLAAMGSTGAMWKETCEYMFAKGADPILLGPFMWTWSSRTGLGLGIMEHQSVRGLVGGLQPPFFNMHPNLPLLNCLLREGPGGWRSMGVAAPEPDPKE